MIGILIILKGLSKVHDTMALAGKVAANTLIQVATKIVSTALALVVMAMITRYLGRYGFGQYTTAVTFVTFFSIAADLGLTLVTTQLLSRPGVDISKTMSNLFSFRLVTGFIIIAIAPIAVLFFPYDGVVKHGVSVAAITFFFVILTQVFVSLFQRELRTDRIAIADIVSRGVILLCTAVAVYLDWGLIGVLWAMAAGNALSFALHFLFARRYAATGWRYDREVWRDIVKHSWPLVITIVLNLVYLKTDTLILSILKSQADVGLYGAAYRVVDVLVSIPFMIGGTVLPIFASRWQSGDREAHRRVWQRVFDASAMIAWPLVVGGFVLAQPIMALVAGSEFSASAPILRILIVAVGFIFFSAFFSYTMVGFERQRLMIPAYLITAVSSVVLYCIFIPMYSYIAAAWITVYSEILISLYALWLVKKESGLLPRLAVFLKSVLASLLMGVVIIAAKLPVGTIGELLATVVAGSVVYFLTLYALKAITRQDIKDLLDRSKKDRVPV